MMLEVAQTTTKAQLALLLAGMMRCDRCVVYDIDRDLEATGHTTHDGNPGFLAAYDRVRHLDPMRPGNFARKADRVVVTGWNFDALRLQRSQYYQDFMRPLRQTHKAELFFRNGSGRLVAGARLSRQTVNGAFSQHEVSLLQLVQPVIESHLTLARMQGAHARHAAFAALSEREWQVTEAAGQGLSNKEICLRIGTGLPTVKSQLASAFRKLSIRSRAELIVLYSSARSDVDP